MVDSSEIARLSRKRMDRHEATSYGVGESDVFDDPDGGLLRYGAAIRRVLNLCDKGSFRDADWGRVSSRHFRPHLRTDEQPFLAPPPTG